MDRRAGKTRIITASLLVAVAFTALVLTSVPLVRASGPSVDADLGWSGTTKSVQFLADDSINIAFSDWQSSPYGYDFPLVEAYGTLRGRTGIFDLRERVWIDGKLAIDDGYWKESGGTDAVKTDYLYDSRITNYIGLAMTTIWTKTLWHIHFLWLDIRGSIILERHLAPLIPSTSGYKLEYKIFRGIQFNMGPIHKISSAGDIVTGILWHYDYSQENNGGVYTRDAPGSLQCIQDRILTFSSTLASGITDPHVSFQLSYTFDDSVKDVSLPPCNLNLYGGKAVIAWDGDALQDFSNPSGPGIPYSSPQFSPVTNDGHQPEGSMFVWGMVYPNTWYSKPIMWIVNGYYIGPTWIPVDTQRATRTENQRVYVNYNYTRPFDMMVGCEQSGGDFAVLGYRNTGNLSMPEWEEVDAWGIHNVTGNRARASPCFGDLDGDGDYDLLISNAINVPAMGYKNIGNNTNPVWQRCTAWDAPNLGGYEQNPALADVDGDGLLDLCVGNELDHTVCFFENTGNSSCPVWTRRTDWDFSPGVTWPSPCFADLDGDGLVDLLVGSYDESHCAAFVNTGNSTNPVWTRKPEWDLTGLPSSQHKKPALVDLNGDGLLDLMVGMGNSTDPTSSKIWAYQNTGNATFPVWTRWPDWDIPLPGMTWIRPAFTNLGGVHDIAIADSASKTVVGQGYSISIDAAVINQGDYDETFNATLFTTEEAAIWKEKIGSLEEVPVAGGNSTILPFTWNTTGFAYGNYTISACAEPVPGETNTADNNFTCNVPVHVGVPGDVSGTTPGVYDGVDNMKDIAYLVSLFQTKPTKPPWYPNADVNNDGVVDMKDIAIAVYYFNQYE